MKNPFSEFFGKLHAFGRLMPELPVVTDPGESEDGSQHKGPVAFPSPYDRQPGAVQARYTQEEWMWLSDREKFDAARRLTEPEEEERP